MGLAKVIGEKEAAAKQAAAEQAAVEKAAAEEKVERLEKANAKLEASFAFKDLKIQEAKRYSRFWKNQSESWEKSMQWWKKRADIYEVKYGPITLIPGWNSPKEGQE